MASVGISIGVGILSFFAFIFDIILFPIYFLVQKPWATRALSAKVKAQKLTSNDTQITFRNVSPPKPMHTNLLKNDIDTMEKVFKFSVQLNTTKRCLGTRQILGEADEMQPDGRMFKKFKLGSYKWLNFIETETQAKFFGRGLREIGIRPREQVVIFAETRAEWMIAAHGLFKQSCTIVTIYATLGDEGITHGITETEVDTVITSHELMPKLRGLLNTIPKVKNIIYFEDQLQKTDTDGFGDIKIYSFTQVIKNGTLNNFEEVPPNKDDIAIIMYTSGSTGVPKGVLLSHTNLLSTMNGFLDNFPVNPDDVYIGLLPLAHVYELLAESSALLAGVPVGYSNPLTLIDSSLKVMKGYKGDAPTLQPTVMTAVPLILDRVTKGINDKVNSGPAIPKMMFQFAYGYKSKWTRRGYRTPLMDKIVFSKVALLLGGKLKLMISGGAPLTAETHEKIKLCLCIDMAQGYGLTETTAGATVMDINDMTFGRAGTPLTTNDLRLENWEEGNYRVTNKPYPQGEIVIGGGNVALGYYKHPEKTKEEFYIENEKRWFKTGDIGEVHADGVLKIIDRKKDLVKLQQGEYISLGKVEAVLKTSPLIESACVYCESTKVYCVALIAPAEKGLTDLAKEMGINGEFTDLCSNKEIEKAVLKSMTELAKKSGLNKFETPTKISMCKELWTPESGLVTAAFKIKRKEIQTKYQADLRRIYT